MRRIKHLTQKSISVVVAAAMIIGLVATPQIVYGETPESMDAATFLSEVKEGALDTNVSLTEAVTITEDMTIDLGGHNLTIENGAISIQGGTVTVKNGTLLNETGHVFRVEAADGDTGAVLNIEEDVTVTAEGCAVFIKKKGSVLNTAGDLTSTGEFATISGNGNPGNGDVVVNITGGSVYHETDIAVYFPNTTELNISGGEICGASAVYHKSGKLNVSGGKLMGAGEKAGYVHNPNGGNATGDALIVEACNYPGGVPEVSISGGEFISINGQAVGYYQQAEEYKLANEKFVTGGSFSPIVTDIVADNAEIKIAETTNVTEDIVVENGQKMVIDLDGKELFLGEKSIFVKNGELTVKNGKIYADVDAFRVESEGSAVLNLEEDLEVSAGDCCVYIKKEGAVLNTKANLLSTGNYAAIQGNGNLESGGIEVNIQGGEIHALEIGVYFPSTTSLNICGGKIVGATAVYHKSGILNITGGELVGDGEKADFVHNNNGANATGDALVIEACDYPGGVPKVSISGGKFTSVNADAIGYYKQTEDYKLENEKFVTGGTFSTSPAEFIADGLEVKDVAGVFEVGVIQPKAEITGGILVDTMDTNGEASICFELLNIPNDADVLVKLYNGTNEIGTKSRHFDVGGTITCSFYTVGTSSSWTQTPAVWDTCDHVMPTHAVLYVNEEEVGSCDVAFTAEEWAAHPGTESEDDNDAWEKDETNHFHTCKECEAPFDVETHKGGTATCVDKAVCEVCDASYGELRDECVDADGNNVCDDCGEFLTEELSELEIIAAAFNNLHAAIEKTDLDALKLAMAHIEEVGEMFEGEEEKELTDEELAELLTLMNCQNEEELVGRLFGDSLIAAVVLGAEEANNAFVADPNAETAKELVLVVNNESNVETIAMFIDGFEESYEAAKAILNDIEHECTDEDADGRCDICAKELGGMGFVDLKAELKAMIEEQAKEMADKGYKAESYTEDSWAIYKAALTGAEALLAKEDVTDAELEEMYKTLKTAYEGLKLVESTGNGNATGGTTGENSGGESKPQTSDNANIALYAVMAIVSLAGLLVIGKKKFFK